MKPKVVVIGARRVRQGIGEYVARAFARADAALVGVVGTSAATAAAARDGLAARHGIDCRPYDDLDRALAAERPDIVAVCSPHGCHFGQLETIARFGAHCLCEKPLGWDDGIDRVATAARIVDAFLSKRLLLRLITQWPATLEDYYHLYPEKRGVVPRRFDMLLGPSTTGAAGVVDSLPHVLSMLQALVGAGEVRAPVARWGSADRREVEIAFGYKYPPAADSRAEAQRSAEVEVHCRLVTTPAPPRPAAYAIDGLRADRLVELPSYRFRLSGGGRSIEMPDPLDRWVARFLAALAAGESADRRLLMDAVALLEPLAAAAARLEAEPIEVRRMSP